MGSDRAGRPPACMHYYMNYYESPARARGACEIEVEEEERARGLAWARVGFVAQCSSCAFQRSFRRPIPSHLLWAWRAWVLRGGARSRHPQSSSGAPEARESEAARGLQ